MKKRVYLCPCAKLEVVLDVDILTLSNGQNGSDDVSGDFNDLEF